MECQNCPIDQFAPCTFPRQHQNQEPGLEYWMDPQHISEYAKPSPKLTGRAALITGGDSSIDRAVAYAFVKEGAKVAIAYYNEDRDAQEAAGHIHELGGDYLLLRGDLKDPAFTKHCVEKTVERFGTLDILVNNHAVQSIQRSILDISREQLSLVFQNNVDSFFYLTQTALPYLNAEAFIINTAYQGHKNLIDYRVTKGAIVALTRSLALSLVEQGIRVNAVLGPIWTPLIPASFSVEEVSTFGSGTSKVPITCCSTVVLLNF